MNLTWDSIWFAIIVLAIYNILLFGVKRVWEKRGPATYPTPVDVKDFDIEYNYVAMPCHHYSKEHDEYCTLDSRHNSVIENGTILHRGTDHQWLQPAIELPKRMRSMTFVDPDMYERNRRAFEQEMRAPLQIKRPDFACWNYNMANGYYCQKRSDHTSSVDEQTRRHGYAGVFWD